jgi:hypothetical protein
MKKTSILCWFLIVSMSALLFAQPAFADTAVPNGTSLVGRNQWETLINVTNTEEGIPINDFHVTIIGANISGKSSFPRGWMEFSNTTNSVTWTIDGNYPINGDFRIKKDQTKVFDIKTDSPFFKVHWATTRKNKIIDSGEFSVP